MNKILSHILVAGASALAGGIGGYIFCKKTMEKKLQARFEQEVNEEIAKIREGRGGKERIIDNLVKVGTPNPVTAEEIRQAVEEYNQSEAGEKNPYEMWKEKTGSKVLSEEEMAEREYPQEESEDDDEDVVDDSWEPQAVMEDYAKQGIQIIGPTEFGNLPPYFNVVEFKYFEEDDVLVDDGEMIVDDIQRYVGDALEHFEYHEEGESPVTDTVFVINGDMGLAIEVTRCHYSYQEWSGML